MPPPGLRSSNCRPIAPLGRAYALFSIRQEVIKKIANAARRRLIAAPEPLGVAPPLAVLDSVGGGRADWRSWSRSRRAAGRGRGAAEPARAGHQQRAQRATNPPLSSCESSAVELERLGDLGARQKHIGRVRRAALWVHAPGSGSLVTSGLRGRGVVAAGTMSLTRGRRPASQPRPTVTSGPHAEIVGAHTSSSAEPAGTLVRSVGSWTRGQADRCRVRELAS